MGQRNVDKRWPKTKTRWAWVRPTSHHEAPDQGLILEWRPAGAGWEALIIRVKEYDGEMLARQEWVPRERLVPVESDPNLSPPWNAARPVSGS